MNYTSDINEGHFTHEDRDKACKNKEMLPRVRNSDALPNLKSGPKLMAPRRREKSQLLSKAEDATRLGNLDQKMECYKQISLD